MFTPFKKMDFDLLSSSHVDCDNVCEKVDQQQLFKTRNSGLCIATGTGEEGVSIFI